MSANPLANFPIGQLVIEYLEHLEVERNLSPLTIRDYNLYLQRFVTWSTSVELKKIADLDLRLLKKYRLHLSRLANAQNAPISVRTQSYYLIALRSFLKWLAKQDVPALAAEKIELPKADAHIMTFLEPDRLTALLQQPDISKPAGLRDRAMMEVLFSTGLRVSELVSLDRDQVNLQAREFGVVGKGRRQRVVFLSEVAVTWLERYLATRSDTWLPVFIRYARDIDPSEDGEKMRLTTRSVQRTLEKYRKQAHLPIKITPHGLRHSFATDLLRNGASIRDVQEMLGHKNLATTQIYTHVTRPELKKVHDQFHGKNN